jgi:acetoin utilization protein AcuB
MRLADIMSTPVITIAPGEAADRAWDAMRQAGTHHLVVTTAKDVVGVVSDRDLGGANGKSVRAGKQVADLMSKRPVTATASTKIRDAANLMRGNSIGCLPVIERGKLVGLVTTSDLLELIGRGVEKPVALSERPTLPRRSSKSKVTEPERRRR